MSESGWVWFLQILMQEARELEGKLSRASNEEQREVISRELEIAKTKRGLANSRLVRQQKMIILI